MRGFDAFFRFSNGWVVKIGRGLDYFKETLNPSADRDLWPCQETVVDIFNVERAVTHKS